MGVVHAGLGWAIVAGFAVLWLWGVGARALKRDAGRWFWRLLAALQGAVLAQLLVGGVLYALGGRQPVLHYLYGGPFPAIVLAFAHARAREPGREPSWIFGWAAFFCFGLTLRALMLGLGLG